MTVVKEGREEDQAGDVADEEANQVQGVEVEEQVDRDQVNL